MRVAGLLAFCGGRQASATACRSYGEWALDVGSRAFEQHQLPTRVGSDEERWKAALRSCPAAGGVIGPGGGVCEDVPRAHPH